MKHIITEKDGLLYLGDDLLFVRYPAGDYDTIDASNPNMRCLKIALYDLRECRSDITYGCTFELNGRQINIDA